MSNRRKLHWFSWQPTPYNVFLFRALANDPEVDLTVHYRERVLASHPWQSTLDQGYTFKYYKCVFGIDWNVLSLSFKENDGFFVIAGWDHPTTIVLINLLILMRRRFAIWTDTPNLNRQRNRVVALCRAQWLKWVLAHATNVMGTGQPAVEALRVIGAPSSKLVNFPFFQDLDLLKPKTACDLCDVSRPTRIVSSGRILNSIKGHDIALKALALATKGHGLPFEYFIAGTGPDLDALRALASKLGIEKKVTFLGWVEPHDLFSLYHNSDILIHPSPVHDPFPNAILEGMAAGLIVLASDTCGSAVDRIKNGINGFIHRAGDFNGLAEQLQFLFKNPNKMIEIGTKARDTAELWPVERGVRIIKEILCAAS